MLELQFIRAFILIYGYHYTEGKRRIWEQLQQLKLSVVVPIIILGDFNEIRKPEERKGCTVQSRNMVEFDELINDMELFDMSLMDCKITWGRSLSVDLILLLLTFLAGEGGKLEVKKFELFYLISCPYSFGIPSY